MRSGHSHIHPPPLSRSLSLSRHGHRRRIIIIIIVKDSWISQRSVQQTSMGLNVLCHLQYNTASFHKSISLTPLRKGPSKRKLTVSPCCSSIFRSDDAAKPATLCLGNAGRRTLLSCLLLSAAGMCLSDVVEAVSTSRRALRSSKIPESDFITLPNGLKYYDLKVGGGPEAVKGSRVAVHYVAKWKGITFMTSRQGLGVGGGTPYGFDVGQSERGTVLKGLDVGVQGMRVGGQRLLIVPPQLAYGSKGVQEIPPNATIELDVELLAIKQSPFGSPVKVVEG